LRVGACQPTLVGKGVSRDEEPHRRVEYGHVSGGVTGGPDDLQPEDLVSVLDRLQRARRVDLTEVFGTDVTRRRFRRVEHVTDAPRMVRVLVGEDHVTHSCPAGPDVVEHGRDRSGAPADAGVDHRDLTSANEHVRRDEAQVHPRPGER